MLPQVGNKYIFRRFPMSTLKPNTTSYTIPYCFNSPEDALAAESAVNSNFQFPNGKEAYATNRTLFVPEHPSRMMRFAIEDFVKSKGGRRSSTK